MELGCFALIVREGADAVLEATYRTVGPGACIMCAGDAAFCSPF